MRLLLPMLIGLLLFMSITASAQEEAQQRGAAAIGAGLAIGLSAIGAGYAVGRVGAVAISVVAEKPELFGRTLIYVVLGEGIAIYGLLIALLLAIA